MEPLMTTEEVAEYLRLEVVTVRRLIARGELPAYRIGGEYRFIGPDLESYVKNQRVGKNEHDRFGFTERARKVLAFANEEAAQLGHPYIGTEHLLLALIREGEGVAAEALRRSGLHFKNIQQQIIAATEKVTRSTTHPLAQLKDMVKGVPGAEFEALEERKLTARAKKVIELAIEEARQMKHHYIGTEHLLLGILREGKGLATTVLIDEDGLQVNSTRKLILEILQQQTTASPVSFPEIPEQAATLLTEDEPWTECERCGAHSPAYFRHCFHCGLKFLV